MLTVRELLEQLKNADPSAVVICERDGYYVPHPVEQIIIRNLAYNRKEGVVLPTTITPELMKHGYGLGNEELDDGRGKPCVLLTTK